jgi:hypothetical protein
VAYVVAGGGGAAVIEPDFRATGFLYADRLAWTAESARGVARLMGAARERQARLSRLQLSGGATPRARVEAWVRGVPIQAHAEPVLVAVAERLARAAEAGEEDDEGDQDGEAEEPVDRVDERRDDGAAPAVGGEADAA